MFELSEKTTKINDNYYFKEGICIGLICIHLSCRPPPGSSRDPSGCGKVPLHNPEQWEYPCHRRVSRAGRKTASHPKNPPSSSGKTILKKETKGKIHLFRKKPDPSLSLSAKVPLVSKVQEVGGSTGCGPSGIPAFYPDPCWESRARSRNSHSYCSGGSEAVGGAEAEREEHPWSDSPGSPGLYKACEGALRAGAR